MLCVEKRKLGDMAQLVERRVRNAEARGSIPLSSTIEDYLRRRAGPRLAGVLFSGYRK